MLGIVIIICITAIILFSIWIWHKRHCFHQWTKVETIQNYQGYRKNDPNCIPSSFTYIMQCSKCGVIKEFKT